MDRNLTPGCYVLMNPAKYTYTYQGTLNPTRYTGEAGTGPRDGFSTFPLGLPGGTYTY